jgi:protein-tyrosine phosphatase
MSYVDLHCHLLPGIDDGAPSLDVSFEMARMAVADGIRVVACTPHIMPGVYNNSGPDILSRVKQLQHALDEAGIPLRLAPGADVHITPELVAQLRDGQALTLDGSRYFLFEPPHHILPPRLEEHIFNLHSAGYVPILTHPERLTWIERSYDLIARLSRGGMLIQVTAGSVVGRFGRRPKYWAERLLDEGMCHILATDAHDVERRPPVLSKARDQSAERLGQEEAINLVFRRPLAILKNSNPAELPGVARAEQQPVAGGHTAQSSGLLGTVRRMIPRPRSRSELARK